MQNLFPRIITQKILKKLRYIPVIAILGPRQTGKSTLLKHLEKKFRKTIRLDLERPSDLEKIKDVERFFGMYRKHLILMDEIQRFPELFSTLRNIVDEESRNGRIVVTGSASRDLLRQSSESLAGRIAYFELTPFHILEMPPKRTLRDLWLQGGFPRSFLQRNLKESFEWRMDFIQTFLERDIPQMGFHIPAESIRRLWHMLAVQQGQILNTALLGQSLGVSHHTVKNYVDILEKTFLIRCLKPFHGNFGKRLVKSPKVYIRDTGLLHALLRVVTHEDLLGHPVYGFSWEGFVIENIVSHFTHWEPFFYRTSDGSEIDLILEKGQKRIAIEIKASSAPQVTQQFWNALKLLQITKAFVIAPISQEYPLSQEVRVLSLTDFLKKNLDA
jgi:predicted AAA+ superfamily ATPase